MVTPEAVSSSGTPMWANARARPPESTIPVEVPDNRRPIRAMSVLNSVSRIRSACQQNQLVPGLGPVQRRPVHGGWLTERRRGRRAGAAEHRDRQVGLKGGAGPGGEPRQRDVIVQRNQRDRRRPGP